MNTFTRWRKASYLTQGQVASLIGVGRRTICAWEAADVLPENARKWLAHQGWVDNGLTSQVDYEKQASEPFVRPRGYHRRRGA